MDTSERLPTLAELNVRYVQFWAKESARRDAAIAKGGSNYVRRGLKRFNRKLRKGGLRDAPTFEAALEPLDRKDIPQLGGRAKSAAYAQVRDLLLRAHREWTLNPDLYISTKHLAVHVTDEATKLFGRAHTWTAAKYWLEKNGLKNPRLARKRQERNEV